MINNPQIKNRLLPIFQWALITFVCLWGLQLAAVYPYPSEWIAPLIPIICLVGLAVGHGIFWNDVGLYGRWGITAGLGAFVIMLIDQIGLFISIPNYTLFSWPADGMPTWITVITVPLSIGLAYLLSFGFKWLDQKRF